MPRGRHLMLQPQAGDDPVVLLVLVIVVVSGRPSFTVAPKGVLKGVVFQWVSSKYLLLNAWPITEMWGITRRTRKGERDDKVETAVVEFWVVGRQWPSGREVFVCYESTASLDVIATAWALAYDRYVHA